MESYSDGRFKNSECGSSESSSHCYSSTTKMVFWVTISVLLIIAIVVPTTLYIIYNESHMEHEAKELIQNRQAEESNFQLKLQSMEESLLQKDENEKRLNAALRQQMDKSKADLKTQEIGYEQRIESLQETYDKQLESIQVKLNVQIEQNRVYYAQIAQLRTEHLAELGSTLGDVKAMQNSLKTIEDFLNTTKEKLQARWVALNKSKDKISLTLKKMNASEPLTKN